MIRTMLTKDFDSNQGENYVDNNVFEETKKKWRRSLLWTTYLVLQTIVEILQAS